MAGTTLVRLEEFNPQNLEKTVWAPVTLDPRHGGLSGAIATRPLVRLEEPILPKFGAHGVGIRHVGRTAGKVGGSEYGEVGERSPAAQLALPAANPAAGRTPDSRS